MSLPAVLIATLFLIIYPTKLAALSAFITNDQCKQSEVFLWQQSVSISTDCDCPPNFVAVKIEAQKRMFCVMLTKPQGWSDICVSSGSADDFYEITVAERTALNTFLRKENVTEFWISVRRESPYDPALKKLPGTEWGTPLDFVEDYDLEVEQTSTGNCLKADIKNNFSKASFEDCSKKFPQLCLYKRNTMIRLFCPSDGYTTRYSQFQNNCYKIEHKTITRTDWKLYDVNSHRKFQMYQNLAKKSNIHCEYSVVQSNLTDQLQEALSATESTDEELFYTAIRDDGIMTLTSHFDCVVYQFEVEFKTPEISLNFDRVHLKLLLMITNPRYLWRERDKDVGVVCYTDADAELLKEVKISRKIWPRSNNQNIWNELEIYELKLYGDFPGLYWCEGHFVPNFTLIKSEKIVAQKKESNVYVYSIVLDTRMFEFDNVLQKSYLKQVIKSYRDYLKSYDDAMIRKIVGLIKGMQVMKIELVDQKNNKLALIVHVSVKYNDRILSDPINSSEEDTIADSLDDISKQYRLKEYMKNLFKQTSNEQYNFKGINSTDICLPDNKNDGLQWPAARIGQTVTPQSLCLIESSGLPMARTCIGDRTYGGVWQQLDGLSHCSSNVSAQTLKLFGYNSQPVELNAIPNIFVQIDHVMDSAPDLIPADVFYLSKTIDNIRSALLNNGSNNVAVIGNKRESYYCGLVGILNRVMYVNESIVFRSQVALNATNILLDSADDIINQLSAANNSAEFLRTGSLNCHDERGTPLESDGAIENQSGSTLFRTSRLILLVANPLEDGISGIALVRINDSNSEQNSSESNFDMYETRLISADEAEDDVMMEENLEIAAYIPRYLLEKIQSLNQQMDENITSEQIFLRVVVSIFFNDNIFRETTNGTIAKANSKIISITVPGYGSDLPGELPIYFRETDGNKSSDCGYWDFEPNDAIMRPKWAYRGCHLARQVDGLSLCKCSHLTSFSRLCMDIQQIESIGVSQVFIGDQANAALDVITATGCALSLLGVIGIFITASIFPTWRSTANSKILLQLSLAIAIEMIIIFLDGPDVDFTMESSKINCTLLGSAFHYIILVTFMWMLVIAYLQFLRYVKVLGRLRPSRFILKASLLSWGLPMVPVVFIVTFDYTLYHKQNNISDICYPHGPALHYGLLLPIGLVILTNMCSFVLIIYNVFSIPDNLTRSSERDLTLSQLRLSLFLFFLLGLPWIFGMMITVRAGNIFSYLFCITAPLQGFVLFVYFIVMDPTARKLWGLKLMELNCNKSLKKQNFDMSVK